MWQGTNALIFWGVAVPTIFIADLLSVALLGFFGAFLLMPVIYIAWTVASNTFKQNGGSQ